MKILVTGALGVIGSTIARQYVEAGHEVVVVDAAEEPRNDWVRERLDYDKLTVRRARIEQIPKEMHEIVASADQVIHAAASTGIPHSAFHPEDDWLSNAEATRVLLEALRENPRPTVVLSSVKPYRVVPVEIERLGGLTEEVPLDPDEPYAASKAAQSMLVTAYARSYGIPAVTLRCSNLYGPAPCHGPRHGWLTWFCISAAIGRPLVVQGSGEQARDMLYATDVASACRAALTVCKQLAGAVFNIGGGRQNVVSVRNAAEALATMSGTPITSGPPRAHEDMLVYANHTAFTETTGWRPTITVDEGLRAVYRWACANREDLTRLYGGV